VTSLGYCSGTTASVISLNAQLASTSLSDFCNAQWDCLRTIAPLRASSSGAAPAQTTVGNLRYCSFSHSFQISTRCYEQRSW
jgi:hypothetical protein